MKGLFLATILSSLLSNNIHTTHHKKPIALPEKCPTTSAIASQGLDYVTPFLKEIWIGVKENSLYNTADNWTFLTLKNANRNGRVAIREISSSLNLLTVSSGPSWDEDYGIAFCTYSDSSSNDSGFVGITYTPPSYT